MPGTTEWRMAARMLMLAGALGAGMSLAGCSGQGSGDAPSEDQSSAMTESADTENQLVTLSVDGMTCEGCVYSVRQTIAKIDGVNACDVSLEEKSASVQVADASVVPNILKAFDESSYTVTSAAN